MTRFLRCERGATAIEYALLAAVLGLGVVTAASTLKNQIYNSLTNIADSMDQAAG